jgi:hypothetical protein
MTIRRLLIVSFASLGVACSTTAAPDHRIEPVTGDWFEGTTVNGIVVGPAMYWQLNDSLGVISGGGNWFVQPGPFGRITVSGLVAGDSLHLTLAFAYDASLGIDRIEAGTYSGTVSSTEIRGTLRRNGDVQQNVAFTRLVIRDPHLIDVPWVCQGNPHGARSRSYELRGS